MLFVAGINVLSLNLQCGLAARDVPFQYLRIKLLILGSHVPFLHLVACPCRQAILSLDRIVGDTVFKRIPIFSFENIVEVV